MNWASQALDAVDFPIVIVDSSNIISLCNTPFQNTFSSMKWVGTPLTFFSPELSQACTTLKDVKVILPLRLNNGNENALYHVELAPIKGGILLQFYEQAEAAGKNSSLTEHHTRLQMLFNSLPEGILFIDKSGKCVEANPSAALITEYTQQELSSLFLVSLIYSEDASTKLRLWLIQTHISSLQIESVWVTKTKKLRIIHCQLKRSANGNVYQALIKDITEEKKTLAELQSKSMLVDAYFQSSTDSIFLLGRQAKILGYNKVAANFIQLIYQKEIQVGESILNYAAMDKREKFMKHYTDALKGIKFEKEIKINHPKLNTWWILRYEPIFNPVGDVIGVSFNGTDITSRKKAEMELHDKIEVIKQNEANVSSIVNNTSLYIWSVDREFKLITINNSLKELLNSIHHYQFEAGQRMIPLFSKELPTVTFIDQWIGFYQRALHGEAFKESQWINNVFYEFSLNPIIENNMTIGVSVFAIDRTQSVMHQQEVTQLNQQIGELKLQALRSAMNPHFVFNAFNSIQYFISRSDRVNAINYLSKFSKLVRSILSSSNQSKIKLAEELSMIQNYIEIEQIRFENKFTYFLEVDETLDLDHIEIDPLLIQPYVENAIQHGLYNKAGNGTLHIRLRSWNEGLEIEIEDNGIGRAKAKIIKAQNFPNHQSVGLDITESRLKLIYPNSPMRHVEIIDLYDDEGNAQGTRCLLKLSI